MSDKKPFEGGKLRVPSGTRSLSWVLKKMTGRLINGKKLKYTTNSSGNYGKFIVTG